MLNLFGNETAFSNPNAGGVFSIPEGEPQQGRVAFNLKGGELLLACYSPLWASGKQNKKGGLFCVETRKSRVVSADMNVDSYMASIAKPYLFTKLVLLTACGKKPKR